MSASILPSIFSSFSSFELYIPIVVKKIINVFEKIKVY